MPIENVRYNIFCLYIIKISKWLMLTMPIMFLFYQENGLSAGDLFILRAVYSAAIVILEVPSGYIGDLFGRRYSLIIGAVFGFVGFFLYCFSSGFWGFLICEIILGVGQSFISGSDSALLYDTLLDAKRQNEYLKVEGRMISMGNFAEAIAAPIGVVLAALSLRTPYYFQAVVAFSAIPAAFFLYEPLRTKIAHTGGFTHILSITRYALVENKTLKWYIIYSSVMGTATLTMAWFVQPYFAFLSLPLAYYGTVIPLLNLSSGFMSMQAYRFEAMLGQKKIIICISLAIGLGYVFLGIFYKFWPLLFLFYMTRGITTPVLRNQINAITPSEIRATVMSLRSLIIRLFFVVLGPVLGWQADRSGVPSAFLASGALFLILGIFSAHVLLRVLKVRDEELP